MSSISGGGGSGGSGVGNVKFLQGNDSVPVGPNPAGIIFTVGAGTIFTTGNAGTFTETFHVGNGTAGQLLTSAGAGLDAVWANAPSSSVTINGDTGTSSGTTFTLLAQSTSAAPGSYVSRVGRTWLFTNDGSGTISLTATDGSNNTLIGSLSYITPGGYVTTGSGNTGVGSNVFNLRGGGNPTSFASNSAFGYQAGRIQGFGTIAITAMNNNSYFGAGAGLISSPSAPIVASQNSFFGTNCGFSSTATTGYVNNSAFGYQAMGAGNLTTAARNSAFGLQGLQHLASGTDNIVLGYQSGTNYTSTESSNIIIGNGDVVGDTFQTRIGYIGSTPSQTACFIDGIAGVSLSGSAVVVTAGGQLGVGSASGIGTIAGDTGTATGATVTFDGRTNGGATVTFAASGSTVTFTVDDTILNNIFLGTGAGNLTTTANQCVVVGGGALAAVTTGNYNTAFGSNVLATVTSGTRNCGFGVDALLQTTGSNNCSYGSFSLLSLAGAGSDNTCIGDNTGFSYTTTESSNILIGSAVVGTVGESNKLRIGLSTGTGTGQLNAAFIAGIQGITVTGTAVLVSASDQLGIAVSSAKYKDNIQDMGDVSSRALNLRPVTFSYKGGTETRFGLIAEEVHEVLPELVVYDKEGDPQTVMYHELPALLLNELQKALKRIEILESKLGV